MHHLEKIQLIPASLEESWNFFSDPTKLSVITPPGMGFRIVRRPGDQMYPGMIIAYKVKPLLGIPVTWVTEITHVVEESYFVDEQRSGPYRFWHHQHFFRETAEGTEIRDIVHYALPLGFIGRILNRWVVRKKLDAIFLYREKKIREIFG